MQRDPKAVEFQGVSQLGRRNVFPSEGAPLAAIPPHRGNRADEHDVRPWNLQPMAGEPRRKLYSSGIEGGTSTLICRVTWSVIWCLASEINGEPLVQPS